MKRRILKISFWLDSSTAHMWDTTHLSRQRFTHLMLKNKCSWLLQDRCASPPFMAANSKKKKKACGDLCGVTRATEEGGAVLIKGIASWYGGKTRDTEEGLVIRWNRTRDMEELDAWYGERWYRSVYLKKSLAARRNDSWYGRRWYSSTKNWPSF